MLDITIEIVGTEELQRKLEGIERNLKGDRLREPWERTVEMVAGRARDNAPHWQGTLLAGITEEVLQSGDEILGVIYSDEFYAPFQERGTDPYFPNISALEDWADDHGVTAYQVALAISRRGIIPLKFFERALVESENEIFELIGAAVAEIMEAEY